MYLARTITDRKELMDEGCLCQTLGPQFPAEQVEKAACMEIWGTSFQDTGADFCVFRLLDANGATIAAKKVDGY